MLRASERSPYQDGQDLRVNSGKGSARTGAAPEGCGFGPCWNSLERGGASCDMCDRVAHLPQPVFRDAAGLRARDTKNAGRDGAPKLSGERERTPLAFRKRHREGPHRGNA